MTSANQATALRIFEAVLVSDGLVEFLEAYNAGTTIFLFFATFACLVALIINITKISGVGANPSARAEAIKNTAITGICFSCLAALDVIYMFLVDFILGSPL